MGSTGWTAKILTIFPDMFPGALGFSLVGRAMSEGLWSLETVDIRDFARDKHRSVDDTPCGGGPGMVMRPDVVAASIDFAASGQASGWPRVYLSPRGRRFDQALAREFAAAGGLIALCGRFEGVDERAIEARGMMEVSLGDFVLSGGEIAAMAVVDATVRLLPGVLGEPLSLAEESFADGLLEYPQYTRPTVWEGRPVPDVLLSGHHAEIRRWRSMQAERITRERRRDLWMARLASRQTTKEDQAKED